MRFLFPCFLLAIVSYQLFFVNSQIVQLFNVNHRIEFSWKFLAHEKAVSNGAGSDYQPFHYFIGGDGTCSEKVTLNENSGDEQLDKAIDSIEDNLSPTYVGASYSNYNATLSFIFSASFNTAVDLEARSDMVGYELQLINNSGKMSCVKILIKKKYIENAKMKRTITIKLKDIIVSLRKQGFTFFYGSARMTVLFVKPSGGYFHYKNLTTKLTDVGLKSLKPDVDITEPIDRTLCYGQFANFTCVARTGKSPNFYTAVIYPYSVEFNEMKGICRYIYNRKHFNFTVNEFDRIDKNILLYFKLLRTENLDVECGNEFLSPSKDNECVKRNEMGNKYCDCNGTCHECYTYVRGGIWSAIEARINKNRSNPCALKPNSAFDLESLTIEEKFNGNRPLDVRRTRFNRPQLEKKHELYDFSMDVLPRLCFTYNATNLIIEVNDVNKQAHSSLFQGQLVQFTLYAPVSSQDPYRKENHKSVRSDFIKPELVKLFKSIDYFDINYSGQYVIPFNKQDHLNKKFIFELRILKSKSMKREKITCMDESDVNNKFNEVDSEYCVKLVGYFQVNENAKIYDTRTCMTNDSAEFRNIILFLSDWRSNGGRLEKLASGEFFTSVVPESFDLESSLQLPLVLVQFYVSDSYLFWVVLAACLLALMLLIAYIVICFCKAFPDKQLVIFISPFIDINSQDILLKIAKVLKRNMCIFKNYHIIIINYGNFWENCHYLKDPDTLVICLNHGLAENQKLLDLDTNTRDDDESILSLNPLLLTYLSVHKESDRCIDVTLCENKSDRPLSFNNKVPNFSISFEYPSFVEAVKLRSNYLASIGKNMLIKSLANLLFKISSHVKLGQAKSSLNSRVKAYFEQSRQEVKFDYFDLFLSGEYL